MKILAIETSCDETAVTYIEARGGDHDAEFVVRGNALYSQAKKHAAYGGVYPTLAKREHAANLVPLLSAALKQAGQYIPGHVPCSEENVRWLEKLLKREPGLLESFRTFLEHVEPPEVDAIAVTRGPGLEPALWVGINFARALAYVWNKPIIPVNHLEGHIAASAVTVDPAQPNVYRMDDVRFPILGLVLSGGHTEFVYAPRWGSYEVVGATRDDSIGEAFDKVARLMNMPYPGGSELSRFAEKGRTMSALRTMPAAERTQRLPRPMLTSGDLDFSFSGLKTAVLYKVQQLGALTDEMRKSLAADFEDAVTDVVERKTEDALKRYDVKTFVLGGGVSANLYIRKRLVSVFSRHEDISLRLPAEGLSTDNAVMIGMAGYMAHVRGETAVHATDDLTADGNLSFGTKGAEPSA